jgi:ketosteroid isomerase-like protein
MKKLLFVLLLGLSSSAFAQTVDDEEAIKKVIVADFDAFINRDFQAWVNAYVDSPQNVYMITPGRSAGQLTYRIGFQNMKAASEASFKTPIKGLFDIIDRKDWNFRIIGNVAWVSYRSTFKMGEDLIPAAELKVFEKMDGQWKISATASIGDYKNATPPIPSKY